MDQGTDSFIGGLASSLNSYLGIQQKQQNEAQQTQTQQQGELSNQMQVMKYKHDLDASDKEPEAKEGQITPDMAEKVMPGAGANLINGFQKQNGRYPTMKEGVDYLKAATDALQPPDNSKNENHQDSLEKQAMDRMSQVRGDQTVQRTEHQRDSAGMAYDTIAKAEAENRPLTELEQNDLIGQLWQARAGKAPTDSDMKLMNDRVAKRDFNQFITYITGNPGIVGSSTQGTLANLKQFIVSSGLKADQQHEAIMAPRLIKPTGLDDDRWQHISQVTRGMSFKDQMSTSDKTYSQSNQSERIPVISPDGKTKGSIPKSQLKEAIANGYKQVQ